MTNMGDETNEERQDNEFAALQAIYGDEVVDNRMNTAWKVWKPLDLLLTLIPLHNSDIQGVHCSVTLHFKCCPSYPDKPPKLAIHKMRGLSTENGNKLLNELESLASRLCGEVMIFQLANHAQQFLHDHNKPSLSFYEEMVQQKNDMEKLKLHDIQARENEERQKIKEEIQRRQEMLREASKRIHRTSNSQESNELGQGDDHQELLFYADEIMSPIRKPSRKPVDVPCTCDSKGVQVLRVTQKNNKKVYIGNCLGHSVNGSTTYLAIDEDTGERLITKKWIIPPATDFQTRNKQLTNLYNDLKTLNRINHPSIIPYTALEICKDTNKRSVKQSVYIFRRFVLGSSLKYIKNRLNLIGDPYESLRLLRHVGLGVFSALKELHGAGMVHRDVRSENVYLDDWGGVKLVGVSMDMRLSEIVDGDYYCDRQTAAQDIYSTGQLLLSIVTSERVYTEIPPELPSSAKDFFARCLTDDEHSQWTAEQLLNHVFLINMPSEPVTSRTKNDNEGSEDEDAKKIPQSSPTTNGHSRLYAEFETIAWLGKGAFGDVLKVKNKLDGGFYAIKRIKLNPESVQLNKKITREVKLLSRLNHENVVRYYNAWIESSTEADAEEDSDMSLVKSATKRDSLEGIVAKLGQDVKVEWSMSEGPVQKIPDTDSEDSEDDDDNDPWFNITSPEDEESSSGIEFEQDSDNQSQTIPSEDVVDAPRPSSSRLNQVLYIQMEFCEKHTLRQAIDNGLYKEHFRCWRLFREIVEGLAHVHQRGMIHRDLKPVNIFLDSNDHVKIGDFGLATKAFTGLPIDDKSKPEEIGGSLTGQIGTALYVAPELLQSASKVIYNQKVDIYSLGIILFEMFHPLETAMERMAVLTQLRSPAVTLPEAFLTEENTKQIRVIRWLLDHEPSLRPTCAELLASEHVPRSVPEGHLSGLLSHALSDRGSRGYQRLISACLDQKQSAAEDYTYHNDTRVRPLEVLSSIKDAVIKVFRSHGAVEFAPPLMIPRAKAWDQHPNAVKVMTASGSVCHLPHDLRLPFARHTAYSDIKHMRRYCVDRVYRERHVPGFHPKEILECAFDIVTAKTDSLWPDAELLVAAYRAASECSLRVCIQLNHTELLRTLLVACGVSVDRHPDIYPILVDVSLGRITNFQLQTHLTSLCVTRRDITNLLHLMEADVPVHELKELVTPLVKQAKWGKRVTLAARELHAVARDAKALGAEGPYPRNYSSNGLDMLVHELKELVTPLVKQAKWGKRVTLAARELHAVTGDAKALGAECQITVAPFLAYNATQHSGVFWQMSVVRDDHKPKGKHRCGHLIAAGGRYDALVEQFWNVARTEKDKDNSELKSSSFGFSMSLERMAAILKKMEIELPLSSARNEDSTLICICVWGTVGSGREGIAASQRAQLARDLWHAGYTVCPWPSQHADTHELRRPCIVLTQDDSSMRAVCDDTKRVREHKVPYIDVLDFVKQQLHPDNNRYPEGTSRTISWNETEKPNSPIVSVTFITASERMTKNSKRTCETQITSQVTSTLVSLGLSSTLGRVRVWAVALACEAACVRVLAATLTAPPRAEDLHGVARTVTLMFPKRQNIIDEAMRELGNIVKQNNSCRSADEAQIYALYSIPDSLCRLIT